WAEILRAW
ncbi:hsp70 family protein, partial [Vibrio parahaemolyticus V-223/04]